MKSILIMSDVIHYETLVASEKTVMLMIEFGCI
jgi:hypothetical protein